MTNHQAQPASSPSRRRGRISLLALLLAPALLISPLVVAPAAAAPPVLRITNAWTMEGDSGTRDANFFVLLRSNSSATVTVDFATRDGSATAPDDYQSTAGTLTFAPGQWFQIVTVPVVGDTTWERNERFYVDLSNASNARVRGGEGRGTIRNDDRRPRAGRSADLVVTQTSDVASVDPAGATAPIVFTVSVRNAGAGAANDVEITDIPGKATVEFATPSQGTCDEPASDGIFTCAVGSLAPGMTATLVVHTWVDCYDAAAVENRASAVTSSVDSNPANDSSVLEVLVAVCDNDG